MKNLFAIITFSILLACNGPQTTVDPNAINVSIAPQKYLIDKISGGKYLVNVVVKPGQNHETYEPTPQQMAQLEKSGLYLLIYKNGFDKAWAANIRARNPNMKVVDLSENIDLLESHHQCSTDEHDHHASGTDPHLWLSPSTMKTLAMNSYRTLLSHFPADSALLRKGYDGLKAEIDAMDSLYAARLALFKGRAFMVYHPVLGYVARDYGLVQQSIEEEGKEPSVEDIKSLIEQARHNNVRLIFVQREFDTRNAELIATETGAHIETLNPLDYQWDKEAMSTLDKLTRAFQQP